MSVSSPGFTDLAGNITAAGAATSDTFKVDKTKPDVTVNGVANGATYTLGIGHRPSVAKRLTCSRS